MSEQSLPDGWFTEKDIQTYRRLVSMVPEFGIIAELGVWKGRSLCVIADIIKEKNLTVVAIDTFEGTASEGDTHKEAKEFDLQKVFEDNLERFGIRDYAYVIKGRTDECHYEFAEEEFDLVFIDADHTTEAVKKDIQNWKPAVKDTGILCGHDYGWPSVQKALNESGLPYANKDNMWCVRNNAYNVDFSICLIAKNEAKTLPRAIASLKEFQDRGGEICLLDTGSTDGTPEIARQLGCKVKAVGDMFVHRIDKQIADEINTRFDVDGKPIVSFYVDELQEGDTYFDFASARNHCADMASNNMIATLDCDEVYTKLDIDRIQAMIALGVEQFEYQFVFAKDQYGNEAVKFVQSKFYDRRKVKWKGTIHEVLQGDAYRQYIGEDIIKLEHFQNHETNRSGYLKGLAVDCFNNPDNDRNSHYFARELFWTGRTKSAIKEFKRHIALNRWPAERSQSMIFLGDAYKALGDDTEALEWYHRAFTVEAGRREPLMRLAEYYYHKKDIQRTACYANAALQIPNIGFYANNQEYYTNLPHEMLYWVCWWKNDKEGSKYHFDKAYGYQPKNPKYIADRKFYYPEELKPVTVNDHPDDSAVIDQLEDFTKKIENRENFTFIKLGDGEIQCMQGAQGKNCDGQEYTEKLKLKLIESFRFLNDKPNIYTGEWEDASMVRNICSTLGIKPRFVDYNILLHRSNDTLEKTQALYKFYKTIRKMHRFVTICFVGPKRLEAVSDFLGAYFLEIPEVNAFANYKQIKQTLIKGVTGKRIYIFSAGLLSKALIADLVKENPNITCIDAGSAFDPIFVGRTRTHQWSMDFCNSVYEDMLNFPYLPKVSIIIPTLKRPEGLKRCLKSIENLNYPKRFIETIVIEDEPRMGVPKRLKEGVEKSTGELIVYGSNDIEFEPESINRAVQASKKYGLVAFNTGKVYSDEGNICEHFMIRRNMIPRIGGEIFDTDFHHVGVDNLLWAKCKKLGEAVRLENAVVTHHHFTRVSNWWDDVYELGWGMRKADRELLEKKLEELK